MLLLLLVTASAALASASAQPPPQERCLTGYMTDVQSWVDESGKLTERAPRAHKIDVSYQSNANRRLHKQLETFSCANNSVQYLSMARNQLLVVPKIFRLTDPCGQPLSDTLAYLTLAGNFFYSKNFERPKFEVQMNATNAMSVPAEVEGFVTEVWSSGFHGVNLQNLRELDLRMCGIRELEDSPFKNMPNLEKLYLGENNIYQINEKSFNGVSNLIHLDISRNYEYNTNEVYRGLYFGDLKVFSNLIRLQTLDLSYTKMRQENLLAMKKLRSLLSLSICQTELINMEASWLAGTSLRYLDVSRNQNIFKDKKALRGVRSTLQVVYADNIALSTLDVFDNLSSLEILLVANNEIATIKKKIAKSLTNLQVLIVDMNRLTTWFRPTMVLMPKLKFLSMRNNNINLISEEMEMDFENLRYIGISGNFVVCNCNARELFLLALRNEQILPNEFIFPLNNNSDVGGAVYHTGFRDINFLISNRQIIKSVCASGECKEDLNSKSSGNFHLFDYNDGSYMCLLAVEGRTTPFGAVPSCGARTQLDIDHVISDTMNTLYFLVIPLFVLPFFIFGYVFRRNIRYFFITMRNSTMISLINNEDIIDENTIFNYDVFVSYCHEDRDWVLDQLLPHVEVDANVSVCLHERDFMVGLSILENIVSCMDRSKTILLILSQKFLLSQWCQFEMHLAQHRLLETRREDLILVLLEEIPRRMRPNTLHYLMLTNTYVVWPKEKAEQILFWRRLNKSLLAHKLRQANNDSIA
ncbi:PREDICTED: toll-like receptor 6 isoform X1 [Papilio xuthus]|uniref:Toll-like receptor 6 isoform X1 n=1 Tax=Papilio xuthus TaxID=66420 RepID=A0AAJ6ZPD9_PAPXU|nr:PREDICTED: toll-like receptor 6 isoform X1 [Papilio xuthus]